MALLVDLYRFTLSQVLVSKWHPLIDRGFGLIYDVERKITWLKDSNYVKTSGRSSDGQLNWYQATEWVAALSYKGVRGWRLPTALNPDGSGPCIGSNCTNSEIGHLVFGPFTTDPGHIKFLNSDTSAKYWNSTEASPTEAYGWDFFSLRQGTLLKDPSGDPYNTQSLTGPVLSWPVHDGDIASQVVMFEILVGIRSLFKFAKH